ncbi:MAG: glycosyltransferase [Halanaerobiales bacterium]|nr:glycosyltransferase [Halanaerobiales bacterium]
METVDKSLNILIYGKNSTKENLESLFDQLKRIYHSFCHINIFLYSNIFFPSQKEISIKHINKEINLEEYFNDRYNLIDLVIIDDLIDLDLNFIRVIMKNKKLIIVEEEIVLAYPQYFIPGKTVLVYFHFRIQEIPFKILKILRNFIYKNSILKNAQLIALGMELKMFQTTVFKENLNSSSDIKNISILNNHQESDKSVDLVIINYNTLSYLKECIESIRINTIYPHNIIVVDNGSMDGSISYLRKLLKITLIENKKNYGYATACNQGIMAGNGEFVAVLNTDLRMSKGWLTEMIETAKTDDKIGVVGPKLVNKKNQIVGAGVTQLDSICSPRGWHEKDRLGLYDKVEDCYSVSGACYLIRRKALNKVGAFDENYFFYFEETDLSLRMLEKGYRIVYCPNAKILHYHEGSLNKKKFNERNTRNLYFRESQYLFENRWKDVLAGACTRKESKDIVVFGVIPWNYRYQRPQQLCSRLSKIGYKILYISNMCHPGGKLEKIDEKIYSFSPDGRGIVYYHLSNLMSSHKIISSIYTVLKKLNIENPILLLEVPYWQTILSNFNRHYLIYDCMDAYEDFSDLKRFCPDLSRREEDLAKNADLIFASSKLLEQKMKKYNKNTILIPNGVESEHFKPQKKLEIPKDIINIPKPIIGYYGAIAEWFDLELIEYAAKRLNNYSFVLIGQHTVDIDSLSQNKNIYFLGEKPYQELPKYIQYFDIAIIPFKMTQLTLATNPVKVYEYLASGKPIVSVDLPEISQFSDVVNIAKSYDEFVFLLEKVLKHDSWREKNKRKKAIVGEDWNDRVSEMIKQMEKLQVILRDQSLILDVTRKISEGNNYG